jgi:hypothetical protein
MMTTGKPVYELEEGCDVYWATIHGSAPYSTSIIRVVAPSETVARMIIAMEGYAPEKVNRYTNEEAQEILPYFAKK